MTDHVTGGNVGDVNTPDEALNVLIAEADWADMHGGDNHDDECPICRSIAMLRAALNHAYPASNEALNRHAQGQPDCDLIEQCAKIAEPWPGFNVGQQITEPDLSVIAVRTEIAAKIRALAAPPCPRRAHKVMTPEEYATMPIIGWHEVCRDVDGFGAIGVRFLGETTALPSTPSGAEPSAPASEDRTDGR